MLTLSSKLFLRLLRFPLLGASESAGEAAGTAGLAILLAADFGVLSLAKGETEGVRKENFSFLLDDGVEAGEGVAAALGRNASWMVEACWSLWSWGWCVVCVII